MKKTDKKIKYTHYSFLIVIYRTKRHYTNERLNSVVIMMDNINFNTAVSVKTNLLYAILGNYVRKFR